MVVVPVLQCILWGVALGPTSEIVVSTIYRTLGSSSTIVTLVVGPSNSTAV